MRRVALALGLTLLVVVSAMTTGQTPPQSAEGAYLFIDVPPPGWRGAMKALSAPGTAQLSALREKLTAAGEQGYGLQLFSRRSLSLAMVLKRDGAGPRKYRIVAAASDSDFLKELNAAAEDGFRLVPEGAKLFNRSEKSWNEQWVAVLGEEPGGERVTYTAVKGTNDAAEQALGEAARRGASLVASFGHPFSTRLMSILEEGQGRSAPTAASGQSAYRIVSTDRTSTLEKEVQQRGAEGFRIAGAGAMAVVMASDPGADLAPAEYRVVAARRLEAVRRELSAAAAAGFRVVAVADHPNERVLLLERRTGTVQPVEYSVVELRPDDAGEVLARVALEGYRAVVLVEHDLVLERPASMTRR